MAQRDIAQTARIRQIEVSLTTRITNFNTAHLGHHRRAGGVGRARITHRVDDCDVSAMKNAGCEKRDLPQKRKENKDMLKNKVALVTGAASGIGRAVALAYAREGARVVVSDLDKAGGEATAAMAQTEGGEAIFFESDVGEPKDAQALVQHGLAHFGRLDIARNNAGIGVPSALLADYPLAGWTHVINIILSGVFYGMQKQINAMLRTGGGAIVNIPSVLAVVGFANSSAYTAAKHGVVGLTQAAALEYSGKGI